MPMLGNVIKQERSKQGITRQELACKVGQTEPWLTDIENGHKGVRVEEFLKLADALRLPVERFFPRPRNSVMI